MKKLAGPGLFRFLLATATVIHHFTRLGIGHACVYLFFCLSGYWIYKMWTESYSQTINPYATYLISRAWRLLPVFILSAAICIGCLMTTGHSLNEIKGSASWGRFLFSQIFIFGYSQLPKCPNVPAWSLDIEAQFYLIAPALILAASVRPLGLLIAAGIGSILSASLLSGTWLTGYTCFFAVGIVAARTDWKPRQTHCCWLAGVALALSLACVTSPYRSAVLVGAHPGPFSDFNEAANILLTALLIPLAIFTTKQRGFSFDRILGDLSYIVYLIHWAALILVAHYSGRLSRLSITLIAFVVLGACSLVTWRWFDHPINSARRRWVELRKPRLAVAAGSPTLTKT